jgi:hypothetical protein
MKRTSDALASRSAEISQKFAANKKLHYLKNAKDIEAGTSRTRDELLQCKSI